MLNFTLEPNVTLASPMISGSTTKKLGYNICDILKTICPFPKHPIILLTRLHCQVWKSVKLQDCQIRQFFPIRLSQSACAGPMHSFSIIKCKDGLTVKKTVISEKYTLHPLPPFFFFRQWIILILYFFKAFLSSTIHLVVLHVKINPLAPYM